jgi:hypothetical protein
MNRHIKHCFKAPHIGSLSIASDEASAHAASEAEKWTPAPFASFNAGVGRSMASDQWTSSHASDIVSLEW